MTNQHHTAYIYFDKPTNDVQLKQKNTKGFHYHNEQQQISVLSGVP